MRPLGLHTARDLEKVPPTRVAGEVAGIGIVHHTLVVGVLVVPVEETQEPRTVDEKKLQQLPRVVQKHRLLE